MSRPLAVRRFTLVAVTLPAVLVAVALADAVDIRNKVEVLDPGQVFVKIRIIRNISHFALAGDRFVCNAPAVNANRPAVKR